MYLDFPLSDSILVMAAVREVLPWSTWPIVPTLTFGSESVGPLEQGLASGSLLTTENFRDLSENFVNSLVERNFKTLIFRHLIKFITLPWSDFLSHHCKLIIIIIYWRGNRQQNETFSLIYLVMFYFLLCLALRYWSAPLGLAQLLCCVLCRLTVFITPVRLRVIFIIISVTRQQSIKLTIQGLDYYKTMIK